MKREADALACAMQEASVTARGVHVHGGSKATERRVFLPIRSAFGCRGGLLGLALTRNHGSGRIHVFVAALALPLPFSLTLQAFVEDEALGTRSHQFTRLTRRSVPRF